MTADKMCPTCGSDDPSVMNPPPNKFPGWQKRRCPNSDFHDAKPTCPCVDGTTCCRTKGKNLGIGICCTCHRSDSNLLPCIDAFHDPKEGETCQTCGWPGVSPHIEPCGSHVFQWPAPPDSRGERCKHDYRDARYCLVCGHDFKPDADDSRGGRCKHGTFLTHRCRDCEAEPIDPKALADFRATLNDSRGGVEGAREDNVFLPIVKIGRHINHMAGDCEPGCTFPDDPRVEADLVIQQIKELIRINTADAARQAREEVAKVVHVAGCFCRPRIKPYLAADDPNCLALRRAIVEGK